MGIAEAVRYIHSRKRSKKPVTDSALFLLPVLQIDNGPYPGSWRVLIFCPAGLLEYSYSSAFVLHCNKMNSFLASVPESRQIYLAEVNRPCSDCTHGKTSGWLTACKSPPPMEGLIPLIQGCVHTAC